VEEIIIIKIHLRQEVQVAISRHPKSSLWKNTKNVVKQLNYPQ
jgi:hypothetical protein